MDSSCVRGLGLLTANLSGKGRFSLFVHMNRRPLDLYPMVDIILRKEGALFLLPGARRVAWLHLSQSRCFWKEKAVSLDPRVLRRWGRGVRNNEGAWDIDYGELWCFEKTSLRYLYKGPRLRVIAEFLFRKPERPFLFSFPFLKTLSFFIILALFPLQREIICRNSATESYKERKSPTVKEEEVSVCFLFFLTLRHHCLNPPIHFKTSPIHFRTKA